MQKDSKKKTIRKIEEWNLLTRKADVKSAKTQVSKHNMRIKYKTEKWKKAKYANDENILKYGKAFIVKIQKWKAIRKRE